MNHSLHMAWAHLNESRARRLRMGHLPHQVAFSWTLLNWAASARRRYMSEKAALTTSKKPAQADLFGGSPC